MNLIDIAETIALILVAIVAIMIGLGTLRRFRDGAVPSLSRTSDRLFSREKEPLGFWMTMFTGLIWLLLGLFLLLLSVRGAWETLN